jgi:hypothetical protein
VNTRTVSRPPAAHKLIGNVPRRFTAADVPPAAVNRELRRLWAAVANRTFRRTGGADAARRAGAEILVAALDCDALVYRTLRLTRARTVPVNLAVSAKQRGHNCDGAGDRAVAAILAGERP